MHPAPVFHAIGPFAEDAPVGSADVAARDVRLASIYAAAPPKTDKRCAKSGRQERQVDASSHEP